MLPDRTTRGTNYEADDSTGKYDSFETNGWSTRLGEFVINGHNATTTRANLVTVAKPYELCKVFVTIGQAVRPGP